MDDRLLKPITEVTYLTTENAWRYRAILRYFYIQHERLRYYLLPGEVLDHLKESLHFREYTEDLLTRDLDQLVEWKNLIPRQETGRVASIEQFKKKRFRYQCAPYTVEIERMVRSLEQMGDSFGGSLERSLVQRMLESLEALVGPVVGSTAGSADGSADESTAGSAAGSTTGLNSARSNEEVSQAWDDAFGHFKRLTQNAADYLAHLKSEKVEGLMKTEAFLVYKDALTEYLRDFMSSLQRTSAKIDALLRSVPEDTVRRLASQVADHQLSIPRLDARPSKSDLEATLHGQWQGLRDWFLGAGGRESDLSYLQNETNETIRRITRFAQRLGERSQNIRSRYNDYLYLARWFAGLDGIEEAHKLSACVFGVPNTRHFVSDFPTSDDMYSEVWDLPPSIVTIKPRTRLYRERTKPSAVVSREREKREMLETHLRERAAERRLIEEIITEGRIALAELGPVDPNVRRVLLAWIDRCMISSDMRAKTETGDVVQLRLVNNDRIRLESSDGVLETPNYEFLVTPYRSGGRNLA
ncbi:MAG TPA: TIGR02677 family protein [Firmicutes bacterium]|nr:TIGR02677 family protein [Bacillota bacterium]